MAERGRSWKPPAEPWDCSPLITSGYDARQLLNCKPVDGWRRGSYIPEDQGLARSRDNAHLSARVYLQQDEAAEFRWSYDSRVSQSSSHGKIDFGTRLYYVEGEGYFTRDFQNQVELMQRNLRRWNDGIAQPPLTISPTRENAEKVDQPACFNGVNDDELEEGELTPSPRRSSTLTISNSPLETQNDDYLDQELFCSGNYRENSCAVDASPTPRKNLKRSIDVISSQPKHRKKPRPRESHIIVVCGQGSHRQREQNFQRNINSNTHKDHKENDGRKAGLALSRGLDSAFGKVGPELNATVARRINSNLDELGKFNTISAPRNVGYAVVKEWKPLQREGNLGKDKSISCGKDGQGFGNGNVPEMQTHQVAYGSKVADHCKQHRDLSANSDARSEVDLSSCVQQAPVAAQKFFCSNYENGKGSKGNVGDCSGTEKEIEKTGDMRNFKDCNSLNKVDLTDGKMVGVIASVEENVCVTDHSGMHSSGLPVKHMYPDVDLSFPSGTSEGIVPFHKFISTIKECDLPRNDLARKKELGRPCFTEATTVSSLVRISTAVTNSTEFLDTHETNSEAKQVDFKTGTLTSDSPAGNSNVRQIDNMRCIMEPNAFRALRDNHLDSKAPSCIEFSGSYPSDRFNFRKRSCKKLKSGHNPNLKINFTHESSTPGSNFAVVTKHKWQNSALRSEVQHNLFVSPRKNVQHNNESSHNSWQRQTLLKPSTSSLQIRPNITSGLLNRIKPWTWTRSNNMVEPPAKAPNTTSPMVKEPCIGTQSQPATYIVKGNNLVRATEPTMSLHGAKRSVSGCLTTVQQYNVESSYTRNSSTTSNVAKTVPSTMKKVVSNLDMSKLSMESFLPPAASSIPYGAILHMTHTGSATSLAEATMAAITGEAAVLHSGLSVSDTVDVNDRDSQGKVYASVGCHVMGIPDSYTLRVRRNQSGNLMSNSKSGMTAHLKGKSNQTLSAPTCNSEASICFMNECSQLQLDSPGQHDHHESNSYQLFQKSKLTDQKPVTSLQVLKESSLPESLQEPTIKAQQNHTNFVAKLHRVLKQKKLATSLPLQGLTLDTGYPQSPSLTLLQKKKIVTSLLPWKRPAYVSAHSRRIKYVSKVSKGLLHILARYVQVGNVNQLVRNSNTISHALVDEKIRWSLHTGRSILSKKQQYSQSLSRFSNSNKEVGICPCTHDSEKVVICTQFLKGTCSNMNCKLIHQVISEPMLDCSNFLLGICTDENCPYRHVNVNPKAPICDGFLKGFCPDSDKCKRKHTYVCPQYASTRNCSERSICNFRHPKSKIKPKLLVRMLKRTSEDKKHYFVPFKEMGHIQSSSSLMNLSGKEKEGLKGASAEDETADYISLSTSEEDTGEDDMIEDNILQRSKAFCFELGMETNDPDLMLKPLLLLRRQV